MTRRRLEGTGSSTRAREDADDDESDSELQDALDGASSADAREEKLKVVVRVRPLQKNEQSWGAARDDEATDAALQSDAGAGAATSSLSIQVRHESWMS